MDEDKKESTARRCANFSAVTQLVAFQAHSVIMTVKDHAIVKAEIMASL